ncbi:hypothetical protein TUM20985_47990 [Mycobacterium antarcticum]|nr:hypothetical protein TUM20985_47990 [Mycolicibacterium sp. TUM20985]GLP77454.1 hypothetical protein TUM20983_45640 [Mycolicibacterium sp. TUM20983]GLP82142.1 hypothetical protein TUM20984_35620 [Mycolicibacterium sp. TUM20984]
MGPRIVNKSDTRGERPKGTPTDIAKKLCYDDIWLKSLCTLMRSDEREPPLVGQRTPEQLDFVFTQRVGFWMEGRSYQHHLDTECTKTLDVGPC